MRKIVAVWARFLASMDHILGKVDPNYRDSPARFTRRFALSKAVRYSLERFDASVDGTVDGTDARNDLAIGTVRGPPAKRTGPQTSRVLSALLEGL
jgi:hypothetical protein